MLRWSLDLERPAGRLRVDNRSASPHSYLRIARVAVLERDAAQAAAVPAAAEKVAP